MTIVGQDSLNTRRTLEVDGRDYDYFSLNAVTEAGLGDISRLPVSLKVLLENLLEPLDMEYRVESGVLKVRERQLETRFFFLDIVQTDRGPSRSWSCWSRYCQRAPLAAIIRGLRSRHRLLPRPRGDPATRSKLGQ